MDSDILSKVTSKNKSSRLPGFYELPINERQSVIGNFAELSPTQVKSLGNFGVLSRELSDIFIENAVGTFSLPLGVATNFLVNGKDILIPMAVEETSVLAAASHGAKLARSGGGFTTSSTDPVMTGQIQLFPKKGFDFDRVLSQAKSDILDVANDGHARLLSRGGGAKDFSWRYIEEINSLVLYLDVHTGDAMGANIVNTMCEKVSVFLSKTIDCQVGLRILTNLNDKRIARAWCRIPKESFDSREFTGKEVVERIEQAYLFAYHDVYRATTHNKGVMNGIDPVVIATGNDWRAVEAAAHSYCCRSGVYQPMTQWKRLPNGDLEGSIELAIAVGTVGGVTKLHPTAQSALHLLGNPSAQGLAEILCAVGLAQNLSALRALASEGIQRGHMSLHQSNLRLRQQAKKSRCH